MLKKVRAFALSNQIESIAQINTDRFVYRSMIDCILTGKLKLPVGIHSVKPHTPGGQWDTEVIFVFVLRFTIDRHIRL